MHSKVPKRYVVMDSENVTPTHVMKFQTAAAIAAKQSPLAIHATHHSPYAYIQYRDGTNAPPCSPQIFYQPTLLQPPTTVQQKMRIGVDGRTTPILLQPPHHQTTPIPSNLTQPKSSGGRIVVLDNAEQFYRPIASTGSANNRMRLVPRNAAYPVIGKHINYVRSGNQIIPYECDTVNATSIDGNRRDQHQCDGMLNFLLDFCFHYFLATVSTYFVLICSFAPFEDESSAIQIQWSESASRQFIQCDAFIFQMQFIQIEHFFPRNLSAI